MKSCQVIWLDKQIDKPTDPVSHWSMKMPPQLHEKVKNQSVWLLSWASVGLKNFHLKFIKESWKPKNGFNEIQLILCFCQNSQLSTGQVWRKNKNKTPWFYQNCLLWFRREKAPASAGWIKHWLYVCLSRSKWKCQKAQVQREDSVPEKMSIYGIPTSLEKHLAKRFLKHSQEGRLSVRSCLSQPAQPPPFLLWS